MTVFNRFLILLGLFLSFNLNAFCQEDDEDVNEKIAEQLRQKYDDVDYFDDVFFVKQNGVWEFADENGKILTNMRIENVECSFYSAEITIKGKTYRVSNPFENGKVLVGRYEKYAYMDKSGNVVTPYKYNEDGDEVDGDPAEIESIINLSDQIIQVRQEVDQGKYTSVKALEKSISLKQAESLSDDVADQLLLLLCKTYANSPKDVDMKTAEDLFEAAIEPCGQVGCEAVLDYYESHGLDKQKRFDYVQSLADDYDQYHACMLLGDFLVEGVLCPKDIQRAIDNYKIAFGSEYSYDGVDYSERAHDKLAELWKKYGDKYDNLLGSLCAENEKVEYYRGEYILLTNDGQKMLIDTLGQVVLPKGDYDIIDNYEDYFVIGDEVSGCQLVKKGGKKIIYKKYEDIKLMDIDDDFQVVVLKDEKWGFYDKEGNPITSMIFDDYSPGWLHPTLELNGEEYAVLSLFNEGLMAVNKEDKCGCIDTDGKTVIPFIYDGMVFSPKGNLFVLKDRKIGVIDRNGKELVPLIYDDVTVDEDGTILLIKKEPVDY